MQGRTERPPPIKSVATAFRVIETIHDRNGATPGEIAETLDLPTSTVSDYLVTLHQSRYLVKTGGEYRTGLRFLELSDQARRNQPIYHVSKQEVDRLAEETGELAHLSVEQDGQGIIVYEREGDDAISLDTYVGRHVQMHCTALGKAMLSELPEEYVERIIDHHGLEAKTDQTITDREELEVELEQAAERGYAVSRGERISSLGCVAVPIRGDEAGEVLGALSLCAPISRTDPDGIPDEVLSMVRRSADRIELDLAFK